jgi:hypothetical protein
LAVMRPKPDEAPVTRMMDLDMMKVLSLRQIGYCWGDGSRRIR